MICHKTVRRNIIIIIVSSSNTSIGNSSNNTSNKDNRHKDNRCNSIELNRKSSNTSIEATERRIDREPSIEPLINTEEWKYRNTPKYIRK